MTEPKPTAKAAAPVWVVLIGTGLVRIPAADVAGALADESGRLATDRDLEIAGIPAEDR